MAKSKESRINWLSIPLVATAARMLNKELSLQVEYLQQENRILRSKVKGRILFDNNERIYLAKAAMALPGRLMEAVINIVKPETILKWHRKLVKQKWDYSDRKDENGKTTRGRPCTAKQKEELVLRLARENVWGYDRIHGELTQMGIMVSETTVRDILLRNGLPINPNKRGMSWKEFLDRHADVILCADLTTHEIWTFCGLKTVYIFVIMHLKSRTMLLCEATFYPKGRWMEQVARNIAMIAEDLGIQPKYLIHDRDPLFKYHFDHVLRMVEIKPVKTSRKAPNMNAHCERMIRSIKEECLNQLIIFGIERMDYVLWQYLRFFNEHRPHQGLDNRTPKQVLENTRPPAIMEDKDIDPAKVECTEFLGGLLKSYRFKKAA